MDGKTSRALNLKWEFRPHTHIVRSWRDAYKKLQRYIELNLLEVENRITRTQARELQKLRRTG